MTINELKKEAKKVLENNILNFWHDKMTDNENGGFYGQMTGMNQIQPQAEKGAILNGRMLWAFSAAYRVLGKKEYLESATRAKRYLIDKFIDKEYGGVYWSLNYKGEPLDTKKQSYAIGFAIYGLSEYARATNDEEAKDAAIKLYYDLEKYAYDDVNGGYTEALTREWKPIADMRLSDKDENGSKTMNTHLHIIEPYTNLLRIWRNERLENSIRRLLNVFTDKLLNRQTYHLDLFFNDEWKGKRNIQSFGHDIEASWLLSETCGILNDAEVTSNMLPIIAKIADAAAEGIKNDGSMISEKWTDNGKTDDERYWWVQCENVIGHLYQYRQHNEAKDLTKAFDSWKYIEKELIDNENGEWYWGIMPDGSKDTKNDKAGFWKCPYHNTRLCTEILEY